MLGRLCFLFALTVFLASPAAAQVVRFQTSVGDFDMVLNPTDNPVLQDYVDNFVHYVENNSYNSSWINRAPNGFVLQMGGFYSHTRRPPPTIESTRPLATFNPVLGQPAAEIGLSNTLGTVALALPGDGQGGTNEDAGTSSFFVNLTDNSFLDPDFTVFAAIPDLTVINQIMALMKTDLTDETTHPGFGAGAGNLGFSDVPLQANGHQVFIKRAFLIDDTLAVARAKAGVESTMALSASAFANSFTEESSSGALATSVVPEPSTALLAILTACGIVSVASRRRRAD
jgi:peptidyl-prolyl cis-trans isomerase B (cyclophilin B)